jgi:hypothetical protein
MSENTYGEDERPAASGMSDAARLQPEKPKSFKEAFAEARSAGDKNFTWQGKKYSTETAGAKSSAPAAGRPRGQRAESPSPQRVEVTAKKYPKDDESKSVSERAKAARERARMGSTGTDERSATERMGGTERKGSSTSTDTRSISDRMKAMRESARSSSTGTDTRSVGERIRSTLGFAKGGSVKGGGCEQRGLRKCKVI